MSRPTLLLQTVYLNDLDARAAHRLGKALYGRLTRPPKDPVAYGAGIPVLCGVAADRVDPSVAERVVILPVVGGLAHDTEREAILDQLSRWRAIVGTECLLLVPTSKKWPDGGSLPGLPIASWFSERPGRCRRMLDEIVLATARLFDEEGAPRPSLFISYAHADLEATGKAAKLISEHVKNDTTGQAFFDLTDLWPGHELGPRIEGGMNGVLVAVRTDAYASRTWCQHELLTAKRLGLPTVTVELLRDGERRSSAYAGNGPTLVWTGEAADPAAVASRAMVEWLRHVHFLREGRRAAAEANLPASQVIVLSRPPELLDLAQGPLRSYESQLVLHPDPELPVLERTILERASPRLRFATPATVFRRLLDGREAGGSASLEGVRVALGLSASPDAGGPDGFTDAHVYDAMTYLARCLISAGAQITYGGDYRRGGFTYLLADLIASYNRTSANKSKLLRVYREATARYVAAPDDLAVDLHHLAKLLGDDVPALVPASAAQSPCGPALAFSDMRRVSDVACQARIVLGGTVEPKAKAGDAGYSGRFPGVVEEAWRSLASGKPLYVAGGFGGAARLVADLIQGAPTPTVLRDETWAGVAGYVDLARAYDRDPLRRDLELPEGLDGLADAVREASRGLLETDESARAWNGLTIEDNHALFTTRDPVLMSSLVLKGLLHRLRQPGRPSTQLEIELVHGSVTDAAKLELIAVATFDGLPLGGAGEVLDRALAGKVARERDTGERLIAITAEDNVDAGWLYLASLGATCAPAEVPERVERAARETAAVASRYGTERIGLVAFGGALIPDTAAVGRAMLRGLAELDRTSKIVWFERDAARFKVLRALLEEDEQVRLSTRLVALAAPSDREAVRRLVVNVRHVDGVLSVEVLPPEGSALVGLYESQVSEAEVSRLALVPGRRTPDPERLRDLGLRLSELLFGEMSDELLARVQGAGILVVHDVPSARIPFEALTTVSGLQPAASQGLSRRLRVPGVPIDRRFPRLPRSGRLRVLVVGNPTEDLSGTKMEYDVVTASLEGHPRIALTKLYGPAATRERFVEEFQRVDVVHYCGHAWFDGPGKRESGLFLAGKERLALEDIEALRSPVRVAFFNACESGRVRGLSSRAEADPTAAFAEFFLRSGVDAYLGTFWQVADQAALLFAAKFYEQVALGSHLATAVTEARRVLIDRNMPDWANYVLYGDADLRLHER